MRTVTLIPGDGIGPEVTEAAVKVIAATGAKIEWERMEAGAEVINKYGTPVPDEVVNSILRNQIALKGPIATPIGGGFAERQRRAAEAAEPVCQHSARADARRCEKSLTTKWTWS